MKTWHIKKRFENILHGEKTHRREGKESTYYAGDLGSFPGLGRSPGGGHGNSFQYSCLQNPMDRGAWWATVQRVAQSQTQLNRLSMHAQVHVCMI